MLRVRRAYDSSEKLALRDIILVYAALYINFVHRPVIVGLRHIACIGAVFPPNRGRKGNTDLAVDSPTLEVLVMFGS